MTPIGDDTITDPKDHKHAEEWAMEANAEAKADTRTCTCHPDDHPPVPCPRKFAYSECVATALAHKMEDELAKAALKGMMPPFVFSTSELHVILRALRNEPGARPANRADDDGSWAKGYAACREGMRAELEWLRAENGRLNRATSVPSEGDIAQAIAENLEIVGEFVDGVGSTNVGPAARAVLALMQRSSPVNRPMPEGWDKLVEYMKWLMQEGAWEGHDMPGDELQDKAATLGIIVPVAYDPAVHGENDCGVEPGEEWFVFADWLKPVQSSGHCMDRKEM